MFVERFIFQFPALAFSSVTSGSFCSRLLLAGSLSSRPHCKKRRQKVKKSTSSEVISIMKFELPFISEKKSTNPSLNLIAVGKNQWVTRLLRLMWDICHDPRTVYGFCRQKFAYFHVHCQISLLSRMFVRIRSSLAVSKAALCSTTVVQKLF